MSLLKRITTTFFALLFAVFSVNLTGVMSLQNAYATNEVCSTGTKLGKWNYNDGSNTYSPDGSVAGITVASVTDKSGTFTVNQVNTTVSEVIVKAGSGANSVKTTPYANVTSGSFNTVGLINGGGQQPEISHITICGTITPVTPTEPTINDDCGTDNDEYVIPNVAGVQYQKQTVWFYGWDTWHLFPQTSWTDMNPNTYDGIGEVKIRAIAENGYTLAGQTAWTLEFTNEACDIEIPTVTAPTPNDVCSTENDSYTIPALATGIEKYQVNINGGGWQDKTPGQHSFTATGEVKVRAIAANGYTITGTADWTFNFDNDQCPVFVQPAAPTHLDECGTANDKLFIPSGFDMGYKYQVNGQDIAAGENPGSGSVTVTAVPLYDYINLTGPTQWPFEFTNIICVTPAEPTLIDKCGDNKDKFVIPSTEGVVYKVDGQVVATGSHFTDSDVVVTAHALNANYDLVGQTEWTLDFSQDLCPAVATEPTLYDICGTHADYYTVPSIEGVRYKVSNTGNPGTFLTVDDGNHWNAGEFYVKAVAKNGYELTGQTEWTLYLDQSKCKVYANVDHTDECASENDSYTIPTTEHVTYEKLTIVGWFWFIPILDWVEIPAGDYDGEGIVLIRAVADQGYKVKGQDTWLLFFSSSKCEQDAVADPTFNDACGVQNDSYTIVPGDPVPGVNYYVTVDGGAPVLTDPNTYYGATGFVEITAEAASPDYNLIGETYWAHQFSDATCADITAEALCDREGVVVTLTNSGDTAGYVWITGQLQPVEVPGNDSVQVTVPYTDWKASVEVWTTQEVQLLDQEFDCTPGRGSVPPKDPPIVTPTGIELPKTGGNGANPLVAIATILLSALAAYGATFYLVNRRELATKK